MKRTLERTCGALGEEEVVEIERDVDAERLLEAESSAFCLVERVRKRVVSKVADLWVVAGNDAAVVVVLGRGRAVFVHVDVCRGTMNEVSDRAVALVLEWRTDRLDSLGNCCRRSLPRAGSRTGRGRRGSSLGSRCTR